MERRSSAKIAAAAAALVIGAGAAFAADAGAAKDLAPVVRDGKIGFVLTFRRWAVHQSESGKVECPNGFNEGPREQFADLYPVDGPKRTVLESSLRLEALRFMPTKEADPFPYKFAGGKIADGMNLDGKVEENDFTSPDGDKGIDNQLFRAIGCIPNFRGPSIHPIWWYENEFLRRYTFNRFMIELSGVESLVNDDDVTVKSYRGLDDLVQGYGEGVVVPGGTQRIDERFGKIYQSTWKGKIVDGVLITEPADVNIPAMSVSNASPSIVLKGMRFQLKLMPGHAEGVMAGYADIDAFNLYLNTAWGVNGQSYGELTALSLYRAMHQVADGYPDPETGEMTAVSAALDVKYTQVNIIHPPKQTASAGPRMGLGNDAPHERGQR